MPDNTLDILIRTQLDASGAKEAGDSVKDLTAATKNSIPVQDEATQSTEKGTLSNKEYRQALHLIGKESPEAAIALKAFGGSVSAVGILVSASAYAVSRLKQDIKNLNQSLDASQFETYKGVVDEFQTGLRNAQIEADSFERALGKIGTTAETASDQLKNLQEIEDAQSKATSSVEAAQKRLEIEQSKGIKDPIERARKQLEIEERFAAVAKQRADLEAQNRLGEKRMAIAGEEDSQGALQTKLDAARASQKGLGFTEESVNKALEVQKARLATIEKERDTKQERYEELNGMGWAFRSTPQQQEMNRLAEQLPSLNTQATQQREVITGMDGEKTGKLGQAKAADEQVKDLENQLKASKERAGKMRRELPTDEAKADIAAAERSQLSGINSKIGRAEYDREVFSTPDGKLMHDAAAAEAILQHGGKTSTTQQASIEEVKRMLDSHHENAAAILDALGMAANNDDALADQIEAIHRRLDETNGNIRSFRSLLHGG